MTRAVVRQTAGMDDPRESAFAAVEVYCEAQVPAEHLDEMRVECSRRGNSIPIFEARPPWNPELTEWSRTKVAQIRFDPDSALWTLYCSDRNGKWWRYEGFASSPRIDDHLREITADPTCIFWG